MVLVWFLLVVLGLLLVSWAAVALFGAFALYTAGELCPKCGADLGVTDRDRFNALYVDPRFGGENPANHCYRCGWRRKRS